MKKIYKNIIGITLFFIIIILGASVIIDIVNLIIKEKINKTFIFAIEFILIYLMITFLLKTKTGENLEESIFGKKFKKKK